VLGHISSTHFIASSMSSRPRIIHAHDQFRHQAGPVIALEPGVTLAELEQGLDWARWLLQSVRQRCEPLCFLPVNRKAGAVHEEWRCFVSERFEPVLAPLLQRALATGCQMSTLVELARELSAVLDRRESAVSQQAGLTLLQATQGAKYQGCLGHYREQVAQGQATAHFLVVWALVARLFQLSPVHACAEALRLEWELGVRDLDVLPEPEGQHSIAQAVMRVARAQVSEPHMAPATRRVG
jgi:hypothetical protein